MALGHVSVTLAHNGDTIIKGDRQGLGVVATLITKALDDGVAANPGLDDTTVIVVRVGL